MEKYCHFALMTPSKGANPAPAKYAQETSSSKLTYLTNFVPIAANAPFSTRVSVTGNDSAAVMISPGDWPVECASGFKIELGGAFDVDRALLGQKTYRAAQGEKNLSSQFVELSCNEDGVLKITGYLVDLTLDLQKMAAPGRVQTYRIAVIPLSGSKAVIATKGIKETTVQG